MTEVELRKSTCLRMIGALPEKTVVGIPLDGSGDGKNNIQFGNTKVFLSSNLVSAKL